MRLVVSFNLPVDINNTAKMTTKSIDYLFEDPPIPSQKFALVTIVGPHMNQKCDVWGMKIRGVTDSVEKAKTLTQKLMRMDDNYDIYTVEVGKFFPLDVEPYQIKDIEYQNSQLNELIKKYLENRELANEQWEKRKNDMVKEAIREGKSQKELASRPEHPVSVLQRIRTFEQKVADLQEQIKSTEEDLKLAQEKFDGYTEEQRELAHNELKNAIENSLADSKKEEATRGDDSVEAIRQKLMKEFDVSKDAGSAGLRAVDTILDEIKELEGELKELQVVQASLSQEHAPNMYKKNEESIKATESKLAGLRAKLTDSHMVNDYINSNYGSSEYSYLDNNVRD